MKTHSSITTLLALAAFASLAGAAEEKKPAPAQVPPAVVQAFQKAYPNVKEAKYEEKAIDGKTSYEVEFKDQGMELEAVYGADGSLVETEEKIKTADLPEAAAQAVKKAHPGATLKEAEKITKPDGTAGGYEVEVKDGKKTLELRLDPGGSILKTGEEK